MTLSRYLKPNVRLGSLADVGCRLSIAALCRITDLEADARAGTPYRYRVISPGGLKRMLLRYHFLRSFGLSKAWRAARSRQRKLAVSQSARRLRALACALRKTRPIFMKPWIVPSQHSYSTGTPAAARVRA
jgi:hypothetical protein